MVLAPIAAVRARRACAAPRAPRVRRHRQRIRNVRENRPAVSCCAAQSGACDGRRDTMRRAAALWADCRRSATPRDIAAAAAGIGMTAFAIVFHFAERGV